MATLQTPIDLIRAVIDREVAHAWKGYGSTIYLELGNLTPSTLIRKDGSNGNPRGELAIGVHWGWRIEERERIVCGSSSEDDQILTWLQVLVSRSVSDVSLVGRLPELQITFSGGLYLTSFMTAEGDPEWEIMDRRGSTLWAMDCEAGQIRIQEWPFRQPTRHPFSTSSGPR